MLRFLPVLIVSTVFIVCIQAASADTLTPDQLENLVAPVALYPDPLLDQILDASQYPKQLVQAGDYISDHQQGQQPNSSWAASVTALLDYPTVLTKLDDDLGWTTRLGIAVASQNAAVQTAIQACRAKSQQAGNLTNNAQQTVQVQNNTINIVPTDPNTIYVPDYDPSLIYTPQPPTHPLVAFGAGVAVGTMLEHNNNWYYGWYHHHYYDHINVAGGHAGYVGPHGAGTVTHITGQYANYTHANHVGPWGATTGTHIGGPNYGYTGGAHVGPYGTTHVQHVYGPNGGMTHVGHTGFYGHTSFNTGHYNRVYRR